jgi:hypothetical protein
LQAVQQRVVDPDCGCGLRTHCMSMYIT